MAQEISDAAKVTAHGVGARSGVVVTRQFINPAIAEATQPAHGMPTKHPAHGNKQNAAATTHIYETAQT
jgi:hypothetical protein